MQKMESIKVFPLGKKCLGIISYMGQHVRIFFEYPLLLYAVTKLEAFAGTVRANLPFQIPSIRSSDDSSTYIFDPPIDPDLLHGL